MYRFRPVISIPILLALFSQLVSCSAPHARLDRDFQAVMDTVRAETGFPGATAAYILPDGTTHSFATGVADLETGSPLKPDARMLTGSVGKVIVSAVALQLVCEGKLDLDDPIATWLGNEDWFGRLCGAESMTLRMLMTHSAGIYDHISDPGFLDAIRRMVAPGSDPDACPNHRQILEYLLDRDPYFPAGQGFHYTDGGYILVGLIIEKVTGRPFYAEARKRILEPLHLDLTVPSDTRDIPGLACGHLAPDNPFGMRTRTLLDGKLNHNPALEWTGGGFASNPGDLVRLAKALYEGDALDCAYLDDLLQTVPWNFTNPGPRNYGLAVIVEETGLGRTYGHTGWYPGYHTTVAYYPEFGFAVAVQVNRDFDSGLIELATRLAALLIARLEEEP